MTDLIEDMKKMKMGRRGSLGTWRQLGVVGVPVSKGQRKDGTEKGPDYLRKAGLVERLQSIGCEVTDHGDIDFYPLEDDPHHDNVKNPRNVAQGTLATADKVEQVLRTEGHCLAIGGDHSMAIGTIMGHARVHPDMAVLWIDAHADINTPLTSDSGNIHGMPLSFLAQELDPYVPHMPGWEDIQACINCDQIAWIGLRDVDPGESKIIDKFGLNAFCMQEVDRHGIRDVLDKALKAIDPDGNKKIHVSFDVDAMDPAHTPSTGTPVSGGLSVREISYIAEEVANTGRLSMVDIAEVNPNIGNSQDVTTTVKTTLDVIARFYGNRRRGSYRPDYAIPEVPVNVRRSSVHALSSSVIQKFAA
ncbi:arginase, hepatic-like [Mercenaria mercenaria]|uniref:arginase, hepatic-like n=1 Tax=Mercenaria mercenaria TaxID=6596 RepID=UPI001E1DA0E9|nr:arginase, hepatic-like [Mercenaria mercenaria]